MKKVSFGRTEAYTQGWRGKTSVTPIRLGDQEIGCIEGSENAGMAGVMSYGIRTSDHTFWTGFKPAHAYYALNDAKDAIRKVGNGLGTKTDTAQCGRKGNQ